MGVRQDERASGNQRSSSVLLLLLIVQATLMYSVNCAPLFAQSEVEVHAWTAQPPARYYRAWLDSVGPIITRPERKTFDSLDTVHEYERFIYGFWQARAGVDAHELALAWERRVQRLHQLGLRVQDERAQWLLRYGRPSYTTTLAGAGRPGCGPFQPIDLHYYSESETRGRFYLLFYPNPLGQDLSGRNDDGALRWSLWRTDRGLEPLLRRPLSRATRRVLDLPMQLALPELLREQARVGCGEATTMARNALMGAIDPTLAPPHLHADLLPPADLQWMDSDDWMRIESEDADTSALGRTELSFWSDPRSSTIEVAQIIDGLQPSNRASSQRQGSSQVLSATLLGRGDEAVRYLQQRFWPPRESAQDVDKLEAFSRAVFLSGSLAPGRYILVLRLYGSHRLPVMKATEVVVPEVGGDDAARLPLRFAGLDSIRVQVPPGPHVGEIEVSAAVLGAEVKSVRFTGVSSRAGEPQVSRLDLTPPFSTTLDVGAKLGRFRIRVEGLNEAAEAVASDAVVLNAGPHRFAIDLADDSASVDPRDKSPAVAVTAQVAVPAESSIERIDFYRGQQPLASLYSAPWQLRLDSSVIGPGPVAIRAVATLDTGAVAEDTLLVNTKGIVDETEVRIVELFFAASDKDGNPVSDVSVEELSVAEEGELQRILEFDAIERLPVSVSVLTDASSSMTELFETVQQAALNFFRGFLSQGDRGSFGVFSHQYELVVPLTSDVEWLADGTRSLRVAGGTALYDSIIYSLYNLGGLGGRRALVVFSDGEDSSSRYRAKDALEFARRAGVAIYPIILESEQTGTATLGSMRHARDVLLRRRAVGSVVRLAQETGGLAQTLVQGGDLEPLLERIAEDLRTQYRLTYQSPYSDADGVYRRVSLHLDRKGVVVRAMRGYFAE